MLSVFISRTAAGADVQRVQPGHLVVQAVVFSLELNPDLTCAHLARPSLSLAETGPSDDKLAKCQ